MINPLKILWQDKQLMILLLAFFILAFLIWFFVLRKKPSNNKEQKEVQVQEISEAEKQDEMPDYETTNEVEPTDGTHNLSEETTDDDESSNPEQEVKKGVRTLSNPLPGENEAEMEKTHDLKEAVQDAETQPLDNYEDKDGEDEE